MISRQKFVQQYRDGAFVWRPSSSVVLVGSGPDHVRYFNARLSQDVAKLPTDSVRRSFVLTPNGKVQGIFAFEKREQDLRFFTELSSTELVAEFKRALLQFKVADRVELADRTAEESWIEVRGAGIEAILQRAKLTDSSSTILPPSGSRHAVENLSISNFPDAETMRVVIAGPEADISNAFAKLLATSGVKEANDEEQNLFRFLTTDFVYGVEISEKNSAAELPSAPYVSFTKGCYTGQEVVEMASARGRASRTIELLLSTSVTALPVDSEVVFEGKVVGTVISRVQLDDCSVARVLLKTGLPTDSVFQTTEGTASVITESALLARCLL